MAGRVALAIAFLVLVGIGAAGVLLLQQEREESDDEGLPVADCDPSSERSAKRAAQAFRRDYVGGKRVRWYSGSASTRAAVARTRLDELEAEGVTVSDVPSGDGWVLLVMYDPDQALPELPGCLDDTPVLYAGNGPFRRD
jgi:hypothetical protein